MSTSQPKRSRAMAAEHDADAARAAETKRWLSQTAWKTRGGAFGKMQMPQRSGKAGGMSATVLVLRPVGVPTRKRASKTGREFETARYLVALLDKDTAQASGAPEFGRTVDDGLVLAVSQPRTMDGDDVVIIARPGDTATAPAPMSEMHIPFNAAFYVSHINFSTKTEVFVAGSLLRADLCARLLPERDGYEERVNLSIQNPQPLKLPVADKLLCQHKHQTPPSSGVVRLFFSGAGAGADGSAAEPLVPLTLAADWSGNHDSELALAVVEPRGTFLDRIILPPNVDECVKTTFDQTRAYIHFPIAVCLYTWNRDDAEETQPRHLLLLVDVDSDALIAASGFGFGFGGGGDTDLATQRAVALTTVAFFSAYCPALQPIIYCRPAGGGGGEGNADLAVRYGDTIYADSAAFTSGVRVRGAPTLFPGFADRFLEDNAIPIASPPPAPPGARAPAPVLGAGSGVFNVTKAAPLDDDAGRAYSFSFVPREPPADMAAVKAHLAKTHESPAEAAAACADLVAKGLALVTDGGAVVPMGDGYVFATLRA